MCCRMYKPQWDLRTCLLFNYPNKIVDPLLIYVPLPLNLVNAHKGKAYNALQTYEVRSKYISRL